MDFQIDDILTLKKQHPCGGSRWKVIRTGADIKIKCLTCEHLVMVPRRKLEKQVKAINDTNESN